MQVRDIENIPMPVYERGEDGHPVQTGNVWPDHMYDNPEILLAHAVGIARQVRVRHIDAEMVVSASALIKLIDAANAVLAVHQPV